MHLGPSYDGFCFLSAFSRSLVFRSLSFSLSLFRFLYIVLLDLVPQRRAEAAPFGTGAPVQCGWRGR